MHLQLNLKLYNFLRRLFIVYEKKQSVVDASYVVKLHQFSARETGQESPRASKGLNETGAFKERRDFTNGKSCSKLYAHT